MTNAASNYLTARNPHNAIAGHVVTYGNESAQALYVLADVYDTLYFGETLGQVFVEIGSPGSPNALATCEFRTPEGVAAKLRIAPSVVADSAELAADALLHEMIHMWQAVSDNLEPGYEGHGPKFAAKCNEIGAILGLPPVGVKGRDGLPNCAQWPLNVRPVGYYGEGPRAAKAVARATKSKAPKGSAKKTAKKAPRRINWKLVAKHLARKLKAASK